jgi:hypothetical protein
MTSEIKSAGPGAFTPGIAVMSIYFVYIFKPQDTWCFVKIKIAEIST